MRMRKRNNLEPRMEACASVWIQDPEAHRGSWRDLMPQASALHLEIGCGKGKFTVEMAELHPDILFLAVERVKEALVLAMEKALAMGLKNVFFLSVDAAELEQLFAPGEVDRIYLNFCDPWPRSKNAKRRLTYHTFLENYRTVLRPDGEIHFKTDNAGLFAWSLEEFTRYGYPVQNVTDDLHKDGIVGVMTGYEEKFHALGTPIHRCEIRMPAGRKDEGHE
ncbi:MAG: tRNA (guanosine(46)-N7)-methyltransferase TrmB [Oscillospiraceae bacterium]|nr:tRNA (guanosine(46)-N7)-methyltransferase TrmB [Oscillospiraceae bacterium]